MNIGRRNEFRGSELFWAHSVKELYVPAVQFFCKALSDRLLPPFSNLAEEADKFADEEFKRLGALPAFCESDGGDLAERAQDNAVVWYSSMAAVRQSVINLYAVGLRHLFEQQLFDLIRHVPLATRGRADYKKDLKALRENGVDFQRFKSWPILEELRLVCNAVKHAEGSATTQLKSKRPDLFIDPIMKGLPLFDRPGAVIQPLAGEDMYLREADIEKYAAAIEGFWDEVSQSLERMTVDAS
jgi:hypothetical protein